MQNYTNLNQLTLSPPCGGWGAKALKFVDYDVVFQEIPDEITLAINLSNCPHRCKGCHSPQLQQNIGTELNEISLSELVKRYEKSITCVCFMGGDATPEAVCKMADFVREYSSGRIKTAWYSGCNTLRKEVWKTHFDYIKLGEYRETLGGLDNKITNQRLYSVSNQTLVNITHRMHRS